MTDWSLKLPSRLRPMVTELAKQELRSEANMVAALVQSAILDRQIKATKQQRENQSS
jgi:hypothetical protein